MFMRRLFAFAVLLVSPCYGVEDDDKNVLAISAPTHKQIRALEPRHDGQKVHLNTFCLDHDGNIVTAVGLNQNEAAQTEKETESTKPSYFVQTYTPDWKLIREIPLDFQPTALNFDASGFLYVGGTSAVCKFSPTGELVKRTLTPNLAGLSEEELAAEAKKSLESQLSQMTEIYEQQINQIDLALAKKKARNKKTEQVGDSDDDDSDDDDSDDDDSDDDDEEMADEAQAESGSDESEEGNPFLGMETDSLEEMRKQSATFLEQIKSQYEATPERIESLVKQLGQVNSIAVGESDVFVTCRATQGFGYEVWRVNRDLDDPKLVKGNLSGCCGQLDIQSDGEHLLIAENTRFRVGIYDRDGKSMLNFGHQDRNGEMGFGSCCNPMNIRCCQNGDVLTAESSIGTIKRYDKAGKLLGNIGKAKISGGCKHVALAHDEKLDRYYMQYQDASTICVLVPKAEIQGETEEEKLARDAREGLGKKLLGAWVVDKAEKTDPNSLESYYQFSAVSFETEGKMTAQAKTPVFGSNLTWEPISQADGRLKIGLYQDQVELFQMAVDFAGDDQIKVGLVYGSGTPNWLGTFSRKSPTKD